MKKPKPPSIVTIAVMTLITVVFWTFFSVYRVFTSKSPTEVPEEILRPINASLDPEALSLLEERYYLEESEIPEIIHSTPKPIEEEEVIIITSSEATDEEPLSGEEEFPSPTPNPISSPEPGDSDEIPVI